MPTVLRERGFAFYFYAHENREPPHVHADKGDGTIKVWLNPVRVAGSTWFEACGSPRGGGAGRET